eukprot:965922-Prorocentrum_minimum.AAC.1
MNLFLGHFEPQVGRPAVWELESDYYLHSSPGSGLGSGPGSGLGGSGLGGSGLGGSGLGLYGSGPEAHAGSTSGPAPSDAGVAGPADMVGAHPPTEVRPPPALLTPCGYSADPLLTPYQPLADPLLTPYQPLSDPPLTAHGSLPDPPAPHIRPSARTAISSRGRPGTPLQAEGAEGAKAASEPTGPTSDSDRAAEPRADPESVAAESSPKERAQEGSEHIPGGRANRRRGASIYPERVPIAEGVCKRAETEWRWRQREASEAEDEAIAAAVRAD